MSARPISPTTLSDDAHAQVRDAAVRIRMRMARTAEDIVEIGRDLIRVKDLLGHGNFLPWIKDEFGMSKESALNFMRVAEQFGENVTVTNLPPTVLYALAAPSTPDEVKDEIIDRAKAGAKVTSADVLDLKRQVKEAKAAVAEERGLRQAIESRSHEVMAERDQAASENTLLKSQIQQLKQRAPQAAPAAQPASPPAAPQPKPVDTTLEALRALWRSAGPATRQAFLADVTDG
ncbi:DUF3102 domain-containing protein [Methylorubrum rhodesianum]|uniref:DUF3102 domain-containing protein n=1 Tax=Methylorubrum rhodesianum TaxID=29427 RepID=UPI003D282813